MATILTNEQVCAHLVSKMLLLQYRVLDGVFLKYAEGYQDFRPITEEHLRDQISYVYRTRCQFPGEINISAIRAELINCVVAV